MRDRYRRFSAIVNFQFMCHKQVLWKKTLFHLYRFWAKNFCLFSKKVQEVFRNCILGVQGKILGKLIFCFWITKTLIDFSFGFSSQNFSENLLKLHSRCPEYFLEGKNCLRNHTNFYRFLRLEANLFLKFGKPFSIRLSKLLLKCRRNVL